MLIVVLMLSISLAMVSLQGEKASRSDRDRQIALNAAEAALKDAEMDIDPQVVLANGRSNLFDATSNLFSKRDAHLAMVIFIKVCVQLP
jgi:type IV pilus assembly protein PilX